MQIVASLGSIYRAAIANHIEVAMSVLEARLPA
jgi:hypothetical protein